MRTITLILALTFSASISEARADACQAAVARYNQASKAEGEAFVAEFRKVMGTTPAAFIAAHSQDAALPIDFCLKTKSVYQARIPRQEAAAALYHAARSACPAVGREKNPVTGGTGSGLDPSETVIAGTKALLANCASVIAAANTGATSHAPPPSNQESTSKTTSNQAARSDQVAQTTSASQQQESSTSSATHQRISDSLALQESFNIWPASTIPPGQKRSGEIHGYHIDCTGGFNRVTNSNTIAGNGALGTARPGAPRQCSGYKEDTASTSTARSGQDTGASSNAPGTNKALPVPPTVPAPTAGQSRQQITVARRSEETSIFQSSSSSTYTTSSSGGWGGMTDCIAMNQYGCTQWINMPSNIPSTTQQTGGNVSAASRAIRYTAPRSSPRQSTANTPAEQARELANFLGALPPDDPRIPLVLAALDKLNKQAPKQVPPIPAKELQCLFTPQQSGSDAPLPPLRLCQFDWNLSNMWDQGVEKAGLCHRNGDDDEFADCSDKNYGLAVLTLLPAMSSYCYGGPDVDISAMAECAKRKFIKAWRDKLDNNIPPNDCATVPPPPPPTWTTQAEIYCKMQPRRVRLRCLLDPKCSGKTDDNDDAPAASNDPPQQQDPEAAPPEPQPLPQESEAWCNFMADAHRRGDYGNIPIPSDCPREKGAYEKPASGPLFSMNPSETEQAINDLLKDAPTKPGSGVLNMTPDELSKQTNDNVPK